MNQVTVAEILPTPQSAQVRRPQSEWAFKLTTKRVDLPLAMIIAKRGLICRSAHLDRVGKRVPCVNSVSTDDLIHLFYSRGGSKPLAELGTFQITRPTFGTFGRRVPGTALYTIVGKSLIELLEDRETRAKGGGYLPDPHLLAFTGWPVKRIGSVPSEIGTLFKGRTTFRAATVNV